MENKLQDANESAKKPVEKEDKKKIIRLKRRLAIIVTVIIGIMLAFFEDRIFLTQSFDNITEDVRVGIKSGRLEYENNRVKDDLYIRSNLGALCDYAGLAARIFEKHGYNDESLAEVLSFLNDTASFYYLDGGVNKTTGQITGTFKTSPDASPLKLDNDQMLELLEKGDYHATATTDEIQASAPVGRRGYVILQAHVDKILQNQSVLASYASQNAEVLLRVNVETGMIEDSSRVQYLNTSVNDLFDEGILERANTEPVVFTKNKAGKYVFVFADAEKNAQIFCGFVSLKDLSIEVFRNIALPVILGWIFLFLILRYVLRFVKNHLKKDISSIEYVKVFGKLYVNKKLALHISGIGSFALILLLGAMIYFQTLQNYNIQSIDAKSSLKSLDYFISQDYKNYSTMQNDVIDVEGVLVDAISSYFMRYPDELCREELDKMVDKFGNVTQIVVYNANGETVFNTWEGASGYTLSKDENMPEHVAWDVLDGKTDKAGYFDSYDASFHVVGRRQDANGLIGVAVSRDILSQFLEMTTPSRAITTANFGLSEKVFITPTEPDTVYYSAAGTSEIVSMDFDGSIDQKILNDGFGGTVRLGDTFYYINTLISDSCGYVLMCSRPAWDLNGFSVPAALLIIILAMALHTFLLVIISSEKLDKPPKKEFKISNATKFRDEMDARMMDRRFRTALRDMFFATCIMIASILAIDAIFSKQSLLSYLFSNNWPKGCNLNSITMILIMLAVAIISGLILSRLIEFFTKNMGGRGETIGHLIVSIIKFIILVVAVGEILIYLGADPTKLITSAGLAGALISFCAQQTVNDFIAGFFIVFEGLFNMGDWITVGEFRGQVLEIGIRTTRIAIGNDIQIINNSELKKVTLMSTNGRGARVCIDVAYTEDVNAVIDLINKNKEYYKKEIPQMLEGPFVDGVTELGASGITIRMWALADQDKVRMVERDLRRVTKNLFDENGIEIPYNQVTVHMGDK